MHKKNDLYLAITFIVILCLTTAGIYAYYQTPETDKQLEEPKEKKIIDNRISPLTNQGLIVEIQRMRHRGLLDKLITPGLSWREKPKFYFITNLDGVEYISKNVAGGAAQPGTEETFFEDWDTIFQENKILRDAKEEQETSEITIKIVEVVKKGLLKLRSEEIEQEKIQVVYDYRTGRWEGEDDSFMDSDGYGHFVGDTFEIWFNIYQSDYDHDGIPYWTEVNVINSDPRVNDLKLDPDNDGIPTAWEWRWGYDPNTWDDHMRLDPDIDGIENIEEYKLKKWFSDPFSQDIYIEADWMERNGIFDPEHVFWKESQQAIIERFCQHGINVYIDDGWPDTPVNGGGELLKHYDKISQDSGMASQFYTHNFPDERKDVFRYVIVGHTGGFNHPQEFNKYDTIVTGSAINKNLLSKKAITGRTRRVKLAQKVMHELGHSIGISPWTFEGCDNFSYNEGVQQRKDYTETWGQYLSVMNYLYIYKKNFLDYSDGSNGSPWDIDDWSHLYLPSFQLEARVFEEAFFEPPCVDKIVNETLEFELHGWEYDKELSEQFMSMFSGESPASPADVDWFVFVKTDEAKQKSNRTIRVYAQPLVNPTYSSLTLSFEGYLDDEENIIFYSLQKEIDNILQLIENIEVDVD